jgi:hypothetical protein
MLLQRDVKRSEDETRTALEAVLRDVQALLVKNLRQIQVRITAPITATMIV